MWATSDAEFATAQCKIWNDWAWETFGKYNDRMSPMASIATADVNTATAEIQRVAKMGFRGLTLPCKPIFGAHDARHPNYNLGMYDPMWAVDPGRRHSNYLPRFDRTRSSRGAQRRRRGDQLRLAFAGADHRAGRASMRLGRARTFPAHQVRGDRVGHRMGRVGARSDGRGLPEASHVGVPEDEEKAERVFSLQRLRVVPGGPGRARPRGQVQPRRQFPVGQ